MSNNNNNNNNTNTPLILTQGLDLKKTYLKMRNYLNILI